MDYLKIAESVIEQAKTAAFEANTRMLARYDALNNEALQRLIANGTQLRRFSPEILAAAEEESFALLNEFASEDADFNTIFQDRSSFRERIYAWHNINEAGFAEYVYARFNEQQEEDDEAAEEVETAEAAEPAEETAVVEETETAEGDASEETETVEEESGSEDG